MDDVETYGEQPYTDINLIALMGQCPKAYEYSIVIPTVLENHTPGIAAGMTRYGVNNGFDAWRNFFYNYVLMAEDLQHILIQDLYDLKQVNESEIDKLFNEV